MFRTLRSVLPVLCAIALFAVPGQAWATWWDCNWSSRVPVTMAAPAITQSNYTLEIMLNASNVPGYNWAGLDADLRVVDSDDKTALTFFVQPRVAGTQVIRLWVYFASVPTSSRTIYVYYGNTSAASTSNGSGTWSTAKGGVRLWTRNYSGGAFTSETNHYAWWNAANDSVAGYGCAIPATFSGQNNSGLFGTGSNIAWSVTSIVYVSPAQAGTWGFRWGPDLGLGGALFVDDIPVQQNWGNDMWWSGSWNTTSQILTGSITLTAGYHVVRGIGEEGCCDGGQEMDARAPGGSWVALGTSSFALSAPSCQASLSSPQTSQTQTSAGASCSGVSSFQVRYSNTGLYCLDQTVTITVVDASGNPYTSYTGTVNLATSTGRGSWLLTTGSGTLTDPTPDDGAATYKFPGGQSSVTLALRYRGGVTPVTVTATQTTPTQILDDGKQGSIAFSPSGFTVTSSPFTNPAGGVPAFASPQTAGTNFNVYITAYGQTPTDATCGIITSYSGAKALKFWSTYVNPSTGTIGATINGTTIATVEASAAAQSVTFTSGQATVTANYKDAGSLSLSMKDDTTGNPSLPTGIRGSTGTFVSRPANLVLSNIKRTSDGFANPAAGAATGTVFIAAGQPFTATVTAVESGGSTTPNFGRETSPATVSLTPTLVLPVSGRLATVSGSFGAFSNGVATGTAFAWPEVGIIKLAATSGTYLGTVGFSGTASGNVGRFIPNGFGVVLNTPVIGTTCSSGAFSYLGQPFTYTVAPVATVTAQALGGTTTQNYTGAFFKLSNATVNGRTYTPTPASPALSLTGLPATTADPAIVDLGTGQATLTFNAGSGLSFVRSGAIVPFTANISLAINVVDADAVSAVNPVTFGASGGMSWSTGAEQRYGRLALRNSAGSELLDLPMTLRAQYYFSTAQGFITNVQDNCTAAPTLTFSNYQLNLAPGETCVRDSGSPGISGRGCSTAAASAYRATALSGDFNLILAAPGAGNSGALTVTSTAPSWLQYLWNVSSGTNTGPAAMGTFGVFPGPGSRIYQREVY